MIKPNPAGTFTVRQVIRFTMESFPSRFQSRVPETERIQYIRIMKIRVFKEGSDEPSYRYRVFTYLKPKLVKKRLGNMIRVFNRRVTSSYQIIWETDKLSLDTTDWKIRLGTGRIWHKAPRSLLLGIGRDDPDRANLAAARVRKFRRGSQFLSEGDFNASTYGLNADFLFRCSWVYQYWGHLYGETAGLPALKPPIRTNPRYIMFFPKHILNFFDLLMQKKLIT